MYECCEIVSLGSGKTRGVSGVGLGHTVCHEINVSTRLQLPVARLKELTGVLSRWKCASLMLSPWLPWGLDRPKRRSLRKGLDDGQYVPSCAIIQEGMGSDDSVLFLIPKGKRYILEAVGVANASDAVLAPAICAGSGVIVRKVCKCGNARLVNQPRWRQKGSEYLV